jgi:hypothetical protein
MTRIVLGEDEGDKVERERSFCVSLPDDNQIQLASKTGKEEEE